VAPVFFSLSGKGGGGCGELTKKLLNVFWPKKLNVVFEVKTLLKIGQCEGDSCIISKGAGRGEGSDYVSLFFSFHHVCFLRVLTT